MNACQNGVNFCSAARQPFLFQRESVYNAMLANS